MYRIDNNLYFGQLIRSLTLTRAANPVQTPVTPQVRDQTRSIGWGGFTGPEVRANVVFPTAIEEIDGQRFVFYGMADSSIGVARLDNMEAA